RSSRPMVESIPTVSEIASQEVVVTTRTRMLAMIRNLALSAAGIALVPTMAFATPSTTYWAPSTATCQAKGVPHVTYDTYYSKQGGYPIDTGLTIGVIPGDKVQAEVGYDLFMPTDHPVGCYLNGKVCVPEQGGMPGA